MRKFAIEQEMLLGADPWAQKSDSSGSLMWREDTEKLKSRLGTVPDKFGINGCTS